MTSALVPLTAIAVIVSAVRPTRSASRPATTLPIPPTPTTRNAARLAVAGSSVPAAAKLAAKNAGIQVHIPYSSHMCPRYPRFANRTERSANARAATRRLNRGARESNGPAVTVAATMTPPTTAATLVLARTACQSTPDITPIARNR